MYKYYDSFISDLTGLLQIPSVLDEYKPENVSEPFGKDIRKALDYILKLGKKDGFKVKNIDNYAGYIEYGTGSEMLGVLCHLDVVPVGKADEWKYPPFSATIEDGYIYARGSSDDKGPSMAAYYALKRIKDENIKINKRIRLIFGCDEESGSRCMDKYLEKEEIPTMSFVPDAEFPLIFAEKGIASFGFKGRCLDNGLISFKSGIRLNVVPDEATAKISIDLEDKFKMFLEEEKVTGKVVGNEYTIIGKTAHGSMPFLGVNAASLLVKFLNKYIDNDYLKFVEKYFTFDDFGHKLNINCYDDEMKDLTINPALFTYGDGEFFVASNIRYPKNFNYEEKMKELKALALELGYEFIEYSNSPYLYVDRNSFLVKTLLSAYQKYTNDFNNGPISIGGGTYARHFSNAVAFGMQFPGTIDEAHQRNEKVSIESLLKAMDIYYEAMKNLCV